MFQKYWQPEDVLLTNKLCEEMLPLYSEVWIKISFGYFSFFHLKCMPLIGSSGPQVPRHTKRAFEI